MGASRPVLCVASALRWTSAQTFIQAHIERLPARVKVLGAFDGAFAGDARHPAFARALRLSELSRRHLGRAAPGLGSRALRRYLRREGIDAVLAAGRALARELRLEAAVSLPGHCPQEAVAAALRTARGFIHPARTSEDGDREGTPVAVLEAAASGLPVVSTRHGGIPDAVLDGETGLLVAEGDEAGTAAAMLRLIDEPRLAGALGARGRAHVERRYAMEDRLAALWRIIEAARGTAGAPPEDGSSPEAVPPIDTASARE